MSVNKVILVGNLGSDPEVRYMDGDRVVANFSLATNETYNDREGNKVTQTEWHRIEMWDGLAKIAEKYLRKGKLIYVEGKIKTDKWSDKEGNDRYTTRIRVNTMQMLGSPDSGSSNQSNSQQTNSSNTNTESTSQSNNDSSNNGGDGFEDLPF